jgi:clan AA aspartic protease (TIGR02281 family)
MRGGFRRITTTVLVALALIPGAAPAMTASEFNEAGKSAYSRGDFATAERLFDQAIISDPRQPLYHYHRGVVLVRLGRLREARGSYENALRLDAPPALAATVRDALRAIGRGAPPDTGRVLGDPEAIKLDAQDGVWFVEVTLNQTVRARFLVDTGATACIVSPAVARSLGIVHRDDTDTIPMRTLNGIAAGRPTSIPSIRVGDVEAIDVRAVVMELEPGMDGILGNTFLGRYAVTLDADRGLLVLKGR